MLYTVYFCEQDRQGVVEVQERGCVGGGMRGCVDVGRSPLQHVLGVDLHSNLLTNEPQRRFHLEPNLRSTLQ